VHLDADEHRKLSEAANRQGQSLTGLVREIYRYGAQRHKAFEIMR
jgi:hypothetical protein